jgi:hypothetical protein
VGEDAHSDAVTIANTRRTNSSRSRGGRPRSGDHYTHDGYYSAKITRISDGKVLVGFKDENIDMWRIGSSYIRSKFGIYRSLSGGRLNQAPVGQSPLLKNESLWLTEFRVYEKNSNPDPGVPHE